MGTPPAGTETLDYTYTTRDEIDSIFSEMGVTLRLEDLYSDKGPALYLEDIIEDATDIINQWLEWKYLPEDMSKNRWIRRRASWIACYVLSQRRGNPKQFVGRYKEIMEELYLCYHGELNVPRLMWRANFTPGYSNLVIDNRYPSPPQKLAPYQTKIGWF